MASAAIRNLDDLPAVDGFRQRGLEMTRIETFTDAAFAFALTLLVVSFDIPTTFDELTTALQGAPAFAASAALLMLFWFAHHSWSRRFGLDDLPTILLSIGLVFIVLVYVYPLKFVSMTFVTWLAHLVNLPLETGVERFEYETRLNDVFIIYGIGFIAMCAVILLLNLHAWRRREALQLNALERFDTRAEMGAWLIVGGAGVLSVLIALLPSNLSYLAGFAYMTLPIVMPIYGVTVGRKRKALNAGA